MTTMSFDAEKIRKDFPILHQKIYNKPLVYFDNAASTQRPLQVTDKIRQIDQEYYGNIHRAAHYMADKATVDFEATRDKVQAFINAPHREQIIFTKGSTESVNLVAFSFGEQFIREGDEIIVSEMEHHSNIVPWQLMASRKKAVIKVLPFDDSGRLCIEELKNLISPRTKLITLAHVSNVLGTINPVKEVVQIARRAGVKVYVDGAQAVQHLSVDVQELDVDFYSFSSHKLYGPNGVGVLYGKLNLLNEMPPYQGGGEMISEVSFSGTSFNELPYKFEAGTPHITGVIGLGAAIDYIQSIGLPAIAAHEKELLDYATGRLLTLPGMRIYGTHTEKCSVIAFNIEGIHAFDLGALLDKMGIAVRTGHHCADPVMKHYGIDSTVRISFAMYNTLAEIDILMDAIPKIVALLQG